jgi:hypothetical protein
MLKPSLTIIICKSKPLVNNVLVSNTKMVIEEWGSWLYTNLKLSNSRIESFCHGVYAKVAGEFWIQFNC